MLRKATTLLLAALFVIGLWAGIPVAHATEASADFADASALADWALLGSGSVDVVDGELRISSSVPYSETAVVNTTLEVDDFTAEFTYRFVEGQNNDGAMFLYRSDEVAGTGYAVYFVHCPDADHQYYIKLTSRPYNELKNGMFYNDDGIGIDYDEEIQVKIVVSGGTHKLYVTKPGQAYGEPIYTVTEETPLYTSGRIGFMQWHENDERNVTVAFDSLKISSASGGNTPVDGDNDEPPKTADLYSPMLPVLLMTVSAAALILLYANKKTKRV